MKSCFTVISEVPTFATNPQDFLKPKSGHYIPVHANVKIINRQQIKTSTCRPAEEKSIA